MAQVSDRDHRDEAISLRGSEREGCGVKPEDAGWEILFTPTRIGAIELRNRIVFQPHYTALSSFDGRPTDRLAAYYEERARGGAALIVTESQAVHPTGKMAGRFIHAWDRDAVIPGYRGSPSACMSTERRSSDS